MLREERQAALNDVVVASLEAADGHDAAADLVDDAAIAERLRELARTRRAAAEDLGQILRGLGDLPGTPDSDLETIEGVISRIKSLLSQDQRQTVLEERARAESAISEAVEAALECPDLPEDARVRLETLRGDAAAAAARLLELATST